MDHFFGCMFNMITKASRLNVGVQYDVWSSAFLFLLCFIVMQEHLHSVGRVFAYSFVHFLSLIVSVVLFCWSLFSVSWVVHQLGVVIL